MSSLFKIDWAKADPGNKLSADKRMRAEQWAKECSERVEAELVEKYGPNWRATLNDHFAGAGKVIVGGPLAEIASSITSTNADSDAPKS